MAKVITKQEKLILAVRPSHSKEITVSVSNINKQDPNEDINTSLIAFLEKEFGIIRACRAVNLSRDGSENIEHFLVQYDGDDKLYSILSTESNGALSDPKDCYDFYDYERLIYGLMVGGFLGNSDAELAARGLTALDAPMILLMQLDSSEDLEKEGYNVSKVVTNDKTLAYLQYYNTKDADKYTPVHAENSSDEFDRTTKEPCNLNCFIVQNTRTGHDRAETPVVNIINTTDLDAINNSLLLSSEFIEVFKKYRANDFYFNHALITSMDGGRYSTRISNTEIPLAPCIDFNNGSIQVPDSIWSIRNFNGVTKVSQIISAIKEEGNISLIDKLIKSLNRYFFDDYDFVSKYMHIDDISTKHLKTSSAKPFIVEKLEPESTGRRMVYANLNMGNALMSISGTSSSEDGDVHTIEFTLCKLHVSGTGSKYALHHTSNYGDGETVVQNVLITTSEHTGFLVNYITETLYGQAMQNNNAEYAVEILPQITSVIEETFNYYGLDIAHNFDINQF